MKNVCADILIYNIQTDIIPPGTTNDDWGQFELPEDQTKAKFSFNDGKGEIILIINHKSSFRIKVFGDIDESLITLPDPGNREHQKAVIEYVQRAFTTLNLFILRYRIETFNYRNRPLKWRVNYYDKIPSQFVIQVPYREREYGLKVEWEVDGHKVDLAKTVNVVIKQNISDQSIEYPYPQDTLHKIQSDVSNQLQGNESTNSVYETSLELLMHAQEIVMSEESQRGKERDATICAAIINTASACEIFVRDFIRQHGTPLHKYIVKEKDQRFSIKNLLTEVLPEVRGFDGKSLRDVNPELMHNIYWLFNLRNSAAHKGKPMIHLKRPHKKVDKEGRTVVTQREISCRIEGWMIYSEWDSRSEFGSYVWDVLALTEWLRSKVGHSWTKQSVLDYWQEQASYTAGTREQKLIDWTLDE